MFKLATARRPNRSGEWTSAKAVTFIVTLAASRNVTLASARAGMSRKSAYALRARDPSFAAAWDQAILAPATPHPSVNEGNKTDNSDTPRNRQAQGNGQGSSFAGSSGPSLDSLNRDLFFALLREKTATRQRLPASAPSPNRRSPCAPAAFSSSSSS